MYGEEEEKFAVGLDDEVEDAGVDEDLEVDEELDLNLNHQQQHQHLQLLQLQQRLHQHQQQQQQQQQQHQQQSLITTQQQPTAQQDAQSIANQAAAALAAAMAAQQLLASAAAICGIDLASLSNFVALAGQPASLANGHQNQTPEQLMAAAVAAAAFLSPNHLVPEDLTVAGQQPQQSPVAAAVELSNLNKQLVAAGQIQQQAQNQQQQQQQQQSQQIRQQSQQIQQQQQQQSQQIQQQSQQLQHQQQPQFNQHQNYHQHQPTQFNQHQNHHQHQHQSHHQHQQQVQRQQSQNHHHRHHHLLGGHHHHSSIQTQQQLLATKGFNPMAVVVGSGQQTEILTPTHLRKAKLMFFYVRYPNSSTLKECFRDVRFNKNNTAQLVKWFSNFREFYYIQMEKFARDAVADDRIQCKEDIVVNSDHEIINQLNNHYNKNRHIELPEVFRQVVEETLKHFFDAIHHRRDQEQSWKKAIYKLIARLDQEVPEVFKTDAFNEHLE